MQFRCSLPAAEKNEKGPSGTTTRGDGLEDASADELAGGAHGALLGDELDEAAGGGALLNRRLRERNMASAPLCWPCSRPLGIARRFFASTRIRSSFSSCCCTELRRWRLHRRLRHARCLLLPDVLADVLDYGLLARSRSTCSRGLPRLLRS